MILAVAISISVASNAQKLTQESVPTAVKQSLESRFPKIKNAKWEKEDADHYEASFKSGRHVYSVSIDATGKWIETEMEIAKKDLPQYIHAAIARQFAGFSIEECEQVENSENKKFYEVEVEKGKVTYELLFSENGELLKKTEESED